MKNNFLALAIASVAILSAQQTDSIQTLAEVTVATKSSTSLQKTNVYRITQEDLQRKKGMQLPELLQTVAGFNINGANLLPTEPKSYNIRGGKNRNVLILIDGVTLREVTGNDYNSYDLRNLSIDNIESIEIINGANSVLYGSNASVSVIDIKTKVDAHKILQGSATLSLASQETFTQNLTLSGRKSHIFYQFSGSNSKSEGITSAKELSGNSFDKDGYEKQNIQSQFGYEYQKGAISVDLGWNHLLYDYDSYEFKDAANKGDNYARFVGINWNHKHQFGELTFHSRYSTSNLEFNSYKNDSYVPTFNTKGYDFFTELYNVYTINENIKLVTGLQHDSQAMDYYAEVFQANFTTIYTHLLSKSDTKMSQFDAFAELQNQWKNLHLNAGIRYTNHSEFGSEVTYSANPFYMFNAKNSRIKIGASIASAFIAPSLYQLYGDNNYTMANKDLNPEKTISYEFNAAWYSKNGFTITANAYYRDENDFFNYQSNPITWLGQYVNVENAYAKGVETSLSYNWKNRIEFNTNFSYTERDQETGMLRIPYQKWNNSIRFSFFKNNSVSFVHQFTSKKEDVYFNESTFSSVYVENKAYHLFHVFAQQKVYKGIEVFGSVKNLFNTSYTDIVGYTEMPRFMELGLKVSF